MTFANIKKLNLSEYYYIFVMIGYVLTLVTDKMRPASLQRYYSYV